MACEIDSFCNNLTDPIFASSSLQKRGFCFVTLIYAFASPHANTNNVRFASHHTLSFPENPFFPHFLLRFPLRILNNRIKRLSFYLVDFRAKALEEFCHPARGCSFHPNEANPRKFPLVFP